MSDEAGAATPGGGGLAEGPGAAAPSYRARALAVMASARMGEVGGGGWMRRVLAREEASVGQRTVEAWAVLELGGGAQLRGRRRGGLSQWVFRYTRFFGSVSSCFVKFGFLGTTPEVLQKNRTHKFGCPKKRVRVIPNYPNNNTTRKRVAIERYRSRFRPCSPSRKIKEHPRWGRAASARASRRKRCHSVEQPSRKVGNHQPHVT
jgi:hypothetical protein